MKIQAHVLIPPGTQVLLRGDDIVWFGALGMPTEDVDYDRMQVNPRDYESIISAVTATKPDRDSRND